jgi:hypothetical protein
MRSTIVTLVTAPIERTRLIAVVLVASCGGRWLSEGSCYPTPESPKMSKRLYSHFAILVAAAIVIACGSERALVSPRLDGALPLGVVADTAGAAVLPVQRQTALAKAESWSFDVGPAGTTVRYPSVGLTIFVPPGAVPATTHITVVCLKGEPIAYRFEPHGLQFAAPLQLTQSLRGTKLPLRNLGNAQLLAGYFASDSLESDAATGGVKVREILPILIDVKGQSAILSIRHFSGYTVASAFESDSSFSLR